MSDLISRQAAIEALRDYLVGKRCPDDGTLTCRLIENEVINKLPPIQPEPCEDDPRADVYYLAEKIGIHQLYALVVQLRGEPEPCEDAVSREAVSSWLKQYGQDVLHGKYKFSLMYIWKNLMSLPSVTPKQRTGEWIPIEGQWHCSVCDGIAPKGYRWAYCPSCGAKMEVTT